MDHHKTIKMKTTICWRTTLHATVLGLLFSKTLAQAATATVQLGPITTLGCYSDAGSLVMNNTDRFQTDGKCQPVCGNSGHAVMAIIGGSTCYCGDILPPLDKQVDKSKCNSPCQGYGDKMCGGIGFYQLYLTGLTGDVETMPNSTSSSSASGHASSTRPAQTVVVTASASPAPSDSSDSGPNKVGIAVGVVVGVIAMAALAGGAIFYMKQKRKREIEEEHKAQAAVNSFIGSRHSDTKSDMRLDPSVASTFRRDSVGSIRDEVDYSRKILQVRNPDRGSMTSVA